MTSGDLKLDARSLPSQPGGPEGAGGYLYIYIYIRIWGTKDKKEEREEGEEGGRGENWENKEN